MTGIEKTSRYGCEERHQNPFYSWPDGLIEEGNLDLLWAHDYARIAMLALRYPDITWPTLEDYKVQYFKSPRSWRWLSASTALNFSPSEITEV